MKAPSPLTGCIEKNGRKWMFAAFIPEPMHVVAALSHGMRLNGFDAIPRLHANVLLVSP
jgi:hypothetical protein